MLTSPQQSVGTGGLPGLSSVPGQRCIKQGWMLKKGSSGGMFAQWKLKYIVLVKLPTSYVLEVYNQCDQSAPAKHSIGLGNAHIEAVAEQQSLINFGRRVQKPFVIVAAGRKITLSGQTKTESEEWMSVLRPLTQTAAMPHRQLTFTKVPSISRRQSKMLPSAHPSGPYHHKFVDQAVSVASSAAPSEDGSGDDIPNIETLSFYEEPILTSAELSKFGTPPISTPQVVRRKATQIVGKTQDVTDWNKQYQNASFLRARTCDESMRKDISLVTIIGNFKEVAAELAIKIINEVHLNACFGEDFVNSNGICLKTQGIIFQFACNYEVSPVHEIEKLVASSSQEVLAVNAVNQIGKDLHTALSVVVDYKGFRIVAMADFGDLERMISAWDVASQTIDEDVTEKLAQLGTALNLKKHSAQISDDRRTTVPLSSSTVVKKDRNNQLYLLNLNEIFPIDPAWGTTSAANDSILTYTSWRRFRPEFVEAYSMPLVSDALTPFSGCGQKERAAHDSEVLKASKYMLETWIPMFVQKLDRLELRPVDSKSLSTEIHRYGINIRYLGRIAQICSLPIVRELCCIDMVARATKFIFNFKLRALIFHFKKVGATNIEDEMFTWTANLFSTSLGNGEKSVKFFEEKVRPEISRKFKYDMSVTEYLALHRPALFHTLQYQCGVSFEDSMDYDFTCAQPCIKSKLVGFVPKLKHVSGLPQDFAAITTLQAGANPKVERTRLAILTIPEEERLAYTLQRHFKLLGPRSKLTKSNESSIQLAKIAAHYNASNRPYDAKRYATAAIAASLTSSCVFGLAHAQLIEALGAIQLENNNEPDPTLLTLYQTGMAVLQWHWGPSHPMAMALHDRVATIFQKAKKFEQALTFHKLSLAMAVNTVGKSHAVTGGYFAKAGYILSFLNQTDDSIQHYNEALDIFKNLNAPSVVLAEVYTNLADSFMARGDFDAALQNAQLGRRLREKSLGQLNSLSVASNLQVAALLLRPYQHYEGVITPQVRTAYKDSVTCYEKAFRYVKNHMSEKFIRSGAASPAPSSSISMCSDNQSTSQYSRSNMTMTTTDTTATGTGFFSDSKSLPISGPVVASPFSSVPPWPRSVLHKITRQIVSLKLAMLESPKHREAVRTLRLAICSNDGGSISSNSGCNAAVGQVVPGMHLRVFDPFQLKEVIHRATAVSPSIYIDGLMARIDDDDETAMDDLFMLLNITDRDTLEV